MTLKPLSALVVVAEEVVSNDDDLAFSPLLRSQKLKLFPRPLQELFLSQFLRRSRLEVTSPLLMLLFLPYLSQEFPLLLAATFLEAPFIEPVAAVAVVPVLFRVPLAFLVF
jgi:hypothetical protein